MKSFIKSALLATLCFSSSAALAEAQWYAGVGGGGNQLSSLDGVVYIGSRPRDAELNFDIGFNFSTRIGAYVTPRLRLETELSYAKTSYKNVKYSGGTIEVDGDIHFGTGTFNLLYDFADSSNAVVPFGGIGIGATYYDIQNGGSGTELTGTGIAGLMIPLGPGMQIEPSYQLLWMQDEQEDLYLHMFRIGIVFGL